MTEERAVPAESAASTDAQEGVVPWHARDAAHALDYWDTDPERGLTTDEVERRRAKMGENALPEPPRQSAIRQLLEQLADPLVGALLVAALVSLGVAMTETSDESWLMRFSDTIAILLIVVVNALLGFFQERRAEQALEALERMAAPSATVRRDGATVILPARALVPGDVVELDAGDSIPADLRLLKTTDFAIEEAALTGESTPVTKRADARLSAETVLADRVNMTFMGTTALRGRAQGLVIATGGYTQLGRIGALIRGAEAGDTPLEKRLARLGKIILLVCLGLSGLLFAIGVLQQRESWTVLLLTAVSLAVAAIPEGLPAITTITLALGMQRMARRGAIVRKLPAVETLGSATVICSDKTGTLTQNKMTVRAVSTTGARYRVTEGNHFTDGELVPEADDSDGEAGAPLTEVPSTVRTLAEVAAICNTAAIEEQDEVAQVRGNASGEISLTARGDPTEIALLTLAAKLGIRREALLEGREIEQEIPFDGDRKRMTIVTRAADGARMAYVKGSADVLLPLCDRVLRDDGTIEPLEAEEQARLLEQNEDYARHALRVLAMTIRPEPDLERPEEQLVFVGFTAMLDPPRLEVRAAVAECHRAGIRVVMITGDHVLTAVAIARELGIWTDDSIAMTGAEIAEFTDQRLRSVVDRVAVFARTTAEQKLRLVRVFSSAGHVVAMTGDGVNDAPALREAHIGVAMGKTGTDVAREAAEMVLADDNFTSIVDAVREGRSIFRNIQKFIFFLNSSNAGLVFAVIVGSFFHWIPPLSPIQLLWINLVTNGLPALALGVDPPDARQMDEPPRDPKEGIIGWKDFMGMLLVGVVMGGAALSLFLLPDVAPQLFGSISREESLARCRTMAFTLLALSPLVHAFNCRSRTRSAFSRLFGNKALWGAVAVSLIVHSITIFVPAMHPIFGTHALSPVQWGVVVTLALLPIPVFETIKLVQWGVRRAERGRASRVG